MGEEVAEYNGAYKASKGMLDEFGEKRVIDTPISELGFARTGVGSTMTGNRPIIEFMTFDLALSGDRPNHQQRRKDPSDVRRTIPLSNRYSADQRPLLVSWQRRTPKHLKAGMQIAQVESYCAFKPL